MPSSVKGGTKRTAADTSTAALRPQPSVAASSGCRSHGTAIVQSPAVVRMRASTAALGRRSAHRPPSAYPRLNEASVTEMSADQRYRLTP